MTPEEREALDVLERVASTHEAQYALWPLVTANRAGSLTLVEALGKALDVLDDYGSPLDELLREMDGEVDRARQAADEAETAADDLRRKVERAKR